MTYKKEELNAEEELTILAREAKQTLHTVNIFQSTFFDFVVVGNHQAQSGRTMCRTDNISPTTDCF